MRLTLRTLLAYLDGILDPNDAQDLGKKVEDSEFATELVHRIRDVMRRLRLAAPSPTDHGPQFDPNTVAEYLDNTLDAEGVVNFEKVCLESDVHLAEVASCHQILALVLGEPAEIDPASRQRMYQVKEGHTGAAPPAIPTVGTTAAVPPVPPPVLELGRGDGESAERKPRPRPTVPEYLREPHKPRHWLPATLAVALLIFFTAAVLRALGQFEPETPLGNLLVRLHLVEAPQELAAKPEATSGGGGEQAPAGQRAAAKRTPPTEKSGAQPGKTSAIDSVAPPAKEPVAESGTTPVKEPAEPPAKQPGEPPAVKPATEPGAGTKPAMVSGTPSTEPAKLAEKKPAVEATAVRKTDSKSAPDAAAASVPKPTGTMGSKSAPLSEAKPAAEPLPPEPLGRFMSSGQVLLKNDPKSGGWMGVAVNQMLFPQRLLALPTYRAKVTLTVGVTLEILGGTQIELLGSNPQEPPGIRIVHGRVVMMPLAQGGSRLRVAFGGRSGMITFSDPESVAAFDVRRLHAPGTNPEMGAPHIVADLYASTGGVSWDELDGEKSGKTLQLTGPQSVSFNGAITSSPSVAKEAPAWINAEAIKTLSSGFPSPDRRASASLAQALPTDQLARVGLQEMYISRPQKEVRWLALRCMGYIGQFRDMVAVLKDPAHRLEWSDYVVELRAAVARDAESAAAVRQALENQYPEQAANLYRMLWGYTNKDLQEGADATLVKALNDESLAVRVLSSWNLADLTGMKLYYRPEDTEAKRQQPILRWRQRQEAKEIRLKTPDEKTGAAGEDRAAPATPDAGL